jgi:hypothetical protein
MKQSFLVAWVMGKAPPSVEIPTAGLAGTYIVNKDSIMDDWCSVERQFFFVGTTETEGKVTGAKGSTEPTSDNTEDGAMGISSGKG